MAWMPMPGQTWTSLAISFLSMWVVMIDGDDAAVIDPDAIAVSPSYRQEREVTLVD